MKFTLEIIMANSEGVLERILGRLRQRGVSIYTINAECSSLLDKIETKITVESDKSAETIMKQLNKLYDVQQLKVLYLENEALAQDSELIHNNSHENHSFSLANTLKGEQNAVCLSV